MTALPSNEELETLVASLAADEEERRLMAGALRLLAYAATEVEPPANLRGRIAQRIQAPATPIFEFDGNYFARGGELDWVELAPGVSLKFLWRDDATGAQTMLVRMGPDLDFPPHPHGFIEDLFLIQGNAWVGDVPMREGDYCRAPAGTRHDHVRSGGAGAYAMVVSR